MGRSRGGLTTKVHALVDANGMPIALKITAGQTHDGRSATDMLDTLGQGNVLPIVPMTGTRSGSRWPVAAPGQHQADAQPQTAADLQRLPLSL